MSRMFRGTVSYFTKQQKHSQGGIKYNHGKDIQFFFADGRELEVRDNKLQFSGKKNEVCPEIGDSIYFEVSLDDNGVLKAAPWGIVNTKRNETLFLRPKPQKFSDWLRQQTTRKRKPP